MKKIAIIGGGISGLTVARLLKNQYSETLFEREDTLGGLIRCRKVDGNLFHICGGHIFNSKYQHVLDWFWSHFNRDQEFIKADRNSIVFMPDGKEIPYPIENHVYLMDKDIQHHFITDLITIARNQNIKPDNFEEFLIGRFGKTLYDLYFHPYNTKVWRSDLKRVPLSWLEGKLPMPTVEEMIYNNINHVKEKQFVHSTFFYSRTGGSQNIIDRLSEGLNIQSSHLVHQLDYTSNGWQVDGETFDKVVFCGNTKELPSLLRGHLIEGYIPAINALRSHGTTAAFCEIDANPYSWIYQPSTLHRSHRIICTGNFSPANNSPSLMSSRITATVEFTDEVNRDEIEHDLSFMPLHPRYITHHYNPCTYPIQDNSTRQMIASLKHHLATFGLYLTGRFADWEYYNMDVSIDAAMNICKQINETRKE